METQGGKHNMETKPNILFFFTDDQRFDTIRALGNKEIKTPNMDELVQKGTAFTQAHIPCGTSAAVCMPSRAMLHTGRTLFHLEGEGQSIPKEHSLLGETLGNAGYETFGIGKWHNGKNAFARSFKNGSRIFFGGMDDHWNVPIYDFDPEGKYDKPRKTIKEPLKNNEITYDNSSQYIYSGKHSSELFCDAAIDCLNGHKKDNPFFMYISFMAPHDPRSMPEEFLSMYNPADISLPPNFCEEHRFDYGVKDIRDELLSEYPRTSSEIKKHIAEYYAMITHLDFEMGRVIKKLKEIGEYENTIIILAGDNGLALGQHGLMGKQSAYEHSVRVPLVFCGKGIPNNEVCDTYVYLLDIFPTICDFAGIAVPKTVEGKSLIPAMRKREEHARESLYFAYTDVIRAVKDKKYKLIEYRNDELSKSQLFDLKNDPFEQYDLIDRPEFKTIRTKLTNKLIGYKNEWNDMSHPLGAKFWNKY